MLRAIQIERLSVPPHDSRVMFINFLVLIAGAVAGVMVTVALRHREAVAAGSSTLLDDKDFFEALEHSDPHLKRWIADVDQLQAEHYWELKKRIDGIDDYLKLVEDDLNEHEEDIVTLYGEANRLSLHIATRGGATASTPGSFSGDAGSTPAPATISKGGK